uniref:NR LBD domain-containing protein n=1 Tax=Panagrellus redivivus TaxID=6233 RepID=A0A7E4UV70_PANRE
MFTFFHSSSFDSFFMSIEKGRMRLDGQCPSSMKPEAHWDRCVHFGTSHLSKREGCPTLSTSSSLRQTHQTLSTYYSTYIRELTTRSDPPSKAHFPGPTQTHHPSTPKLNTIHRYETPRDEAAIDLLQEQKKVDCGQARLAPDPIHLLHLLTKSVSSKNMRELERRRPCELFVPRVKESRLCSVCGYSLIDHDVAPPPAAQPFASVNTTPSISHYHVPVAANLPILSLARLQHSASTDTSREAYSGLLIPQYLLPQGSSSSQYNSGASSPAYMATSNYQPLESQLAPSSNSAFSEYRRCPSKDSINISEFSASPLSFKASPFPTNEAQIFGLESASSHGRNHLGSTHPMAPVLESASASPNRILKPKPIPMPRPYLNRNNLTVNGVEKSVDYDAESINIDDEPHTPALFRRIRQKRRDRSASTHADRAERSPVAASTEVSVPVVKSDNVVRPQNFKEILNRFQTAAADPTPVPPPPFQRHHSVRLPMTVHQNRRFTLGGDQMLADAKLAMAHPLMKSGTTGSAGHPEPHQHSATMQPPPVVRLRASAGDPENLQRMSVSQINIRDSKSHPTPPKRHTQTLCSVVRRDPEPNQHSQNHHHARNRWTSGSFIEAKARNSSDSDVEDEPRSSPDEEPRRHSIMVGGGTMPMVTVTTQQPPLPKKRSTTTRVHGIEGADTEKPKPANRSQSSTSNSRKLSTPSAHSSSHSNNSSIRNLAHIDENSNEDKPNGRRSNNGQVEYLSGGSDSGYPRGPWSQANSTETPSSLGSPRSPSQPLRSPNPLRSKAAEDLYAQMTVQHTNTLAFLADNFTDIARIHGEFSEFGQNCFDEVSVETLEFKQAPPLIVKEKIALFDATFIGSRYQEHKVTVMLAPTCQYAPLMGRHAERSGFGPPVLAEIEEPESVVHHLLDQAGLESHQRSSVYRVVVMPPLSVCSFHSLAAQNMLQEMNVQRYEHHVCFILLQLLCALKVLQSDGVEHLSNNFKEFLLTYRAPDLKRSLEELHHLPRLMLLRETMEEEIVDDFSSDPNEATRVGVCKYALRALCTLLNHKMHSGVPPIAERTEYSRALRKCAELLHAEKSSSLTEAKNLLEFTFFCGRVSFDGEMEAKLWLDERRAHEVNRAVRLLADRAECLSDARERMYVQFLLSTTPRSLYQTYKQSNTC